MKISVFDTTSKSKISKKTVRQIVQMVVEAERCPCEIVNVIITDSIYLKKLNAEYLDKKKVTNVLSFNLDDIFEIYVNTESASSVYDLYYYIVHGILHLAGYQHDTDAEDKKMEDRCKYYLDTVLAKGDTVSRLHE